MKITFVHACQVSHAGNTVAATNIKHPFLSKYLSIRTCNEELRTVLVDERSLGCRKNHCYSKFLAYAVYQIFDTRTRTKILIIKNVLKAEVCKQKQRPRQKNFNEQFLKKWLLIPRKISTDCKFRLIRPIKLSFQGRQLKITFSMKICK